MTTRSKIQVRPSAYLIIGGALLIVLIVGIVQAYIAQSAPSITTSEWQWIFRPKSLDELYDLSDVIVVGTVTGVTEGPQWVGKTTSPDQPTITADSMLIDITIDTPVKGIFNSGDTLTIYRQVNISENTHEIGQTYLMFLQEFVELEGSHKPAEGSHGLFAAEGNYSVVDGRLVWKWANLANDSNSFAASELDGAQLSDILQRIEALNTVGN